MNIRTHFAIISTAVLYYDDYWTTYSIINGLYSRAEPFSGSAIFIELAGPRRCAWVLPYKNGFRVKPGMAFEPCVVPGRSSDRPGRRRVWGPADHNVQ